MDPQKSQNIFGRIIHPISTPFMQYMKIPWVRRLCVGFVFLITLVCGALVFILNTRLFDSQPVSMLVPENALYLDESQPIDARVADLLSYMTLHEKVGQMALVEKYSITNLHDIARFGLGGMLSGSGAKPDDNTAAGWKRMIEQYQIHASLSRLGIPLLYGVDAVHGHAHVPDATVFPHAIGLGATRNFELVKKIANATAVELDATGVNWSFSPTLDIPQDIRWGRTYEAFSDDPQLVAELGTAYLEGLQQSTDSSDKNIFVLGTLKHFVGLGAMKWGTSGNSNYKIDQGYTPADETLLRDAYLPPFENAINAGALSIMIGLNTWGEDKMVLQQTLLTDLLKEELGFKGFLVSDWYGVHEGRRHTFLATVQAVNAGVDMVMLPFDYQTFVRDLVWANRLGLVSDERIDDAVSRILYAKFALGLFDKNNIQTPLDRIANPAHKALAREAVSQSLVLLKNENSILPISPSTSHIRVAGSAADNIGRQMGAWTIEWQGIDGNWSSDATSILEGIRLGVSSGTEVQYDERAQFVGDARRAQIGIVVVGERPYAEGVGDTQYPTLTGEDLQVIKDIQSVSERVVVVIVSGRPLLLGNDINSFDALVAAWLPGSEGGGVADVLFGSKPFVGTLPLPWPRFAEQIPLTSDGQTADGGEVAFPRYFGLFE